jgi:hypothetical protein
MNVKTWWETPTTRWASIFFLVEVAEIAYLQLMTWCGAREVAACVTPPLTLLSTAAFSLQIPAVVFKALPLSKDAIMITAAVATLVLYCVAGFLVGKYIEKRNAQ